MVQQTVLAMEMLSLGALASIYSSELNCVKRVLQTLCLGANAAFTPYLWASVSLSAENNFNNF